MSTFLSQDKRGLVMFVKLQAYKIGKITQHTVGTTAIEIELQSGAVIIQNQSSDKIMYVKEKTTDGLAVTSATGFAVYPQTQSMPLTGDTLSIITTAAAQTIAVIRLE